MKNCRRTYSAALDWRADLVVVVATRRWEEAPSSNLWFIKRFNVIPGKMERVNSIKSRGCSWTPSLGKYKLVVCGMTTVPVKTTANVAPASWTDQRIKSNASIIHLEIFLLDLIFCLNCPRWEMRKWFLKGDFTCKLIDFNTFTRTRQSFRSIKSFEPHSIVLIDWLGSDGAIKRNNNISLPMINHHSRLRTNKWVLAI